MESNKRSKAKKPKVAEEIDFDLLERELKRKNKGGNHGKNNKGNRKNYKRSRNH